MSSAWWRTTKSVIKQFHEWLAASYGTPLPFRVVDKRCPHGFLTRGIPDTGRLLQARPDVLPLLPDAVDAIVAAAARPTPSGQQRGQQRRDVGLIEWLVGTGMRITPATHLSTYEVPPRSGGDFDWLHTPAAINKYGRAVRSAAFAGRLEAARVYMAGDRLVIAEHGGGHAPSDPLRIVEADGLAVTWRTGDDMTVRRQWNDVDIGHHRRLANADGSSPLLWLTQTGSPMSTRQAQHIVKEAVKVASAANHTVPADAHPHSLRHTYATFSFVMWLLRDDGLYPSGQHRIQFGLVDAVRHVTRAGPHRRADDPRLHQPRPRAARPRSRSHQGQALMANARGRGARLRMPTPSWPPPPTQCRTRSRTRQPAIPTRSWCRSQPTASETNVVKPCGR